MADHAATATGGAGEDIYPTFLNQNISFATGVSKIREKIVAVDERVREAKLSNCRRLRGQKLKGRILCHSCELKR